MKNSKKTDLFQDIDEKLKRVKEEVVLYDFEVAVDSMKGLDEKKKILWKQIYKNAIDDRAYALTLFTSAFQTLEKTATDHIALNGALTKYLEKMSKSNQQLLELSDMVSRDGIEAGKYDPDDMYNQIGKDDE